MSISVFLRQRTSYLWLPRDLLEQPDDVIHLDRLPVRAEKHVVLSPVRHDDAEEHLVAVASQLAGVLGQGEQEIDLAEVSEERGIRRQS